MPALQAQEVPAPIDSPDSGCDLIIYQILAGRRYGEGFRTAGMVVTTSTGE